jgi:hypothetical protein
MTCRRSSICRRISPDSSGDSWLLYGTRLLAITKAVRMAETTRNMRCFSHVDNLGRFTLVAL